VSILVNSDTKVIFQGITGKWGRYYSEKMLGYGTKIVAGVTPGRGGETVNDVPVYDTVKEALRHHEANASITYTPAPFARDALLEAADAGLSVLICVVEGIPVQDTIFVKTRLKGTGCVLIGPNSPGIITPGEFVSGFMPPNAFKRGNIGIVSRSGTLTYQVADILSREGFGQSTCLGIGGDPVVGLSYVDVLKMYEKDPETEAIILIGEIGGGKEEEAARYIKENRTKPVVSFIVGRSAPEGKTMGHAGAIVSGGKGTYQSKLRAFEDAGVPVARLITELPALVRNLF
jgi:succinyl-CoA synthetase alpha subunit